MTIASDHFSKTANPTSELLDKLREDAQIVILSHFDIGGGGVVTHQELAQFFAGDEEQFQGRVMNTGNIRLRAALYLGCMDAGAIMVAMKTVSDALGNAHAGFAQKWQSHGRAHRKSDSDRRTKLCGLALRRQRTWSRHY